MDTKRFICSADLKAAGDQGVIEALVSVFDIVDHGGDIIRRGAYAESLARKLPNFVWSHDWSLPIGKVVEAAELEPGDPKLPERARALGGLYVKAQCNLETQRGREAFSDLKMGAITEFSIGYRTVASSYNEDTGVRELLEIELFEVSPVLVGMNQATELISVKGDQPRAGMTLDDHAKDALAAAKALVERFQDYARLKEADGRKVSPERIAQAKELAEHLLAFVERHEAENPEVMALRKSILEQQIWRLQLHASS